MDKPRCTIFPHFVCRVSGLSADAIASLLAADTVSLLDEHLFLIAQLNSCGATLTDDLYDLIGSTQHRKRRNRLLQLRRDVHNHRIVEQSQVAAFEPLLPQHIFESLSTWCGLQEKQAQLLVDAKHTFDQEIATARLSFQHHLQDADFQKGLLISSRSLFAALAPYLDSDVEEMDHRAEKVERGLLRYFTRAATKATPFSTFCAVIPGAFAPASNDAARPLAGLQFTGDPGKKHSQVRLNKSLYGILLNHLKPRPPVRRHLPVEYNPTIREEEGRHVFLASIGGREVFQRVSQNEVLALISTLLSEQTSVPLGTLIDALQRHSQIEASQEEATQYLDKLIEIGLLRFRTGIHEQEANWDLPLVDLLRPVEDEHARRVVMLLKDLRDNVDAYAAAALKERAKLLKEMNTLIEKAFEEMGIEATIRRYLPVYEDATADAVATVPKSAVSPALETFSTFIRLTRRLAWPRNEQTTLRHFFDTHYGPEHSSVPLLQFYEDYYREHFKAHLEKQRTAQPSQETEEQATYDVMNPFGLDLIARHQHGHKQLSELIARRWQEHPEAETINLTEQDLRVALEGVPPCSDTCGSYSSFTTLVPPGRVGESAQLIIPNGRYLAGYGKFFSRFLYLFPNSIIDKLYQANQNLTDQYLAEICGDANFNANLHPPLLPWEISYPTGESGKAEAQLLTPALQVEPAPDNRHALILRDRHTGRQVLPIDLGFLNPRMRPPLFQLLTWFTPSYNFFLSIPRHPSEHLPEESTSSAESTTPENVPSPPPKILCRPRITFKDTLILSRKCWHVPDSLFPERVSQETLFEYFVRVNQWRRVHDLPDEVFVRIQPLPKVSHESSTEAESAQETEAEQPGLLETIDAQDEKPDEGESDESLKAAETEMQAADPRKFTRRSRDWHKPQYIDFRSPLLVGLFGKLTVNLEHYRVVLEERLPHTESLPRYAGRAYATELILQFDFPHHPEHQAPQQLTEEEVHVVT